MNSTEAEKDEFDMTDLLEKFTDAADALSTPKTPMRKCVYDAYFDHLSDITTDDLPEEIQPIYDAFVDRLTSADPPGDIGNDEAGYLAKDILHMADVVKANYKPEFSSFIHIEGDEAIRPVVLDMEPTKEEKARLNLRERRSDFKDRRKVPTYISDDRRCGLAERRKKK